MAKTVAKSKIRIGTLVLSCFLLVGMIPLAIVSYVSTESAERVHQQSAMDKLFSISERQFELIEGFGKEKVKDLDSISTMPFIIDFVESLVEHKSESASLPNYVRWRSLMKKYRELYGFHDILIINLKGDVVFSLAEERDLGTNLLSGPHKESTLANTFARARDHAEVRISNYRYYAPSGRPAIFMGKQIYKVTEFSTPIAVIVIQLTGNEIDHVVNNYIGLGRTGETVLGQKNRDHFIFVNHVRHVSDSALGKAGKMGGVKAKPMQHALLQEKGSGLSVDYRGNRVLAVWSYLPLWRWGMVVKVDVDEAYEALIDHQYFVAAITLIALVVILALAVVVSRAARKSLLELLTASVDIANGKFDIQAPESGIVEFSNLSRSIKKMAVNITGMIQGREAELSARIETQTQLDTHVTDLASINIDLASRIDRLDKSRKAMFYMVGDINRISSSLGVVNKELEAFSYSVSHDLRAPLRAMDGFSRALLDDHADALDAEGKYFLDRICQASQKMSVLIDDLLGLSRITRQELHISELDLSQMTERIVDSFKEREPERQVKIAIGEDLTFFGDRNLVNILLENLLGNAWKFTSNEPKAEILVGATKIEGKRTCFVRDNGAGFDMAYAGKIFDAFQRLHGDTEFKGSGIGLAIVQRIINRHGGSVWVKSEPDKGTTFFFTL